MRRPLWPHVLVGQGNKVGEGGEVGYLKRKKKKSCLDELGRGAGGVSRSR